MARAPVTGWTEGDRGPHPDAEERARSVHRAIEIREKRRRSSRRVSPRSPGAAADVERGPILAGRVLRASRAENLAKLWHPSQ
jgi:hypothetical protein